MKKIHHNIAVLSAAAASILLMSGCVVVADEDSGETGASQQEVTTAEETATEESTASEEVEVASSSYGVGDTIDFGGIQYTLNSVTTVLEDAISSPPSEDVYLVLDVTITNNTSEEFSSSSLISFDLKGSDAYTYDLAIFVDTKGSLDVSVPAGDVARGEIAFDVPNLDSYRLSVTPDFLSDSGVFEILSSDIQ